MAKRNEKWDFPATIYLDDVTTVFLTSRKGSTGQQAGMIVVDHDASASSTTGGGGEVSELDEGTYLVYDAAMGGNLLGAVWVKQSTGDADYYLEYILAQPINQNSCRYPFAAATSNGTVRFKRINDGSSYTSPTDFENDVKNNQGISSTAVKKFVQFKPGGNTSQTWPAISDDPANNC